MDATRPRRARDRARQKWYARHRQQRFARFLGFHLSDPAASHGGFAGPWLRGVRPGLTNIVTQVNI
jgi:hypothetical protein